MITADLAIGVPEGGWLSVPGMQMSLRCGGRMTPDDRANRGWMYSKEEHKSLTRCNNFNSSR